MVKFSKQKHSSWLGRIVNVTHLFFPKPETNKSDVFRTIYVIHNLLKTINDHLFGKTILIYPLNDVYNLFHVPFDLISLNPYGHYQIIRPRISITGCYIRHNVTLGGHHGRSPWRYDVKKV